MTKASEASLLEIQVTMIDTDITTTNTARGLANDLIVMLAAANADIIGLCIKQMREQGASEIRCASFIEDFNNLCAEYLNERVLKILLNAAETKTEAKEA